MAQLIEQFESLNLSKGTENSLLAKLNSAAVILGDLHQSNDHAAANVLEAFINQVEAQYGKKIAAEDAEALIEAADAILRSL